MSPADTSRASLATGLTLLAVSTVVGFVGTSIVLVGLPGALSSQPPNVVIIDIDRMAASHMPCYGYDRNTTPVMCSFGERNMLFTDAVAQSGWTASSVASLFTGQYPGVHGLEGHSDMLRENRLTLAEILQQNGYGTAAFPANFERGAAALLPRYNVDQGFDVYTRGGRFISHRLYRIAHWLDDTEKPFFLYVQGFGPHRYAWGGVHAKGRATFDSNYTGTLHDRRIIPRDALPVTRVRRDERGVHMRLDNGTRIRLTARDVGHIIAHYDEELRVTDAGVGRLFALLRSQGVFSNSIIVLTANHGEVLNATSERVMGRRLFGHGAVWEGDIRVPLMVRFPGGMGESTRAEQVELIDVFPTILDAAGLWSSEALKRRLQGVSFYTPEGGASKEAAFAVDLGGERVAVRNATWKLVANPDGTTWLYRAGTTPARSTDASDEHPSIVDQMQTWLRAHRINNQMLRTRLYRNP